MIKKIINHINWKLRHWTKITIPQKYYCSKLPKKVLSGPFMGMKYINSSTGSVVLPKLIGTYESELNFIWEEVRNNKYKNFIDVGAAEGYYAVGVTKYVFNNTLPTVAFELTAKGRNQIKELAFLNNVNNIQILDACTLDSLSNVILDDRCLLLIDVEGAEFYLLDETKINFSNTDILVEIHPAFREDLEHIIFNRFVDTHDISTILPQNKELPKNIDLPDWALAKEEYLVNEFRGPQSWLWMKSKKYNS